MRQLLLRIKVRLRRLQMTRLQLSMVQLPVTRVLLLRQVPLMRVVRSLERRQQREQLHLVQMTSLERRVMKMGVVGQMLRVVRLTIVAMRRQVRRRATQV